MQRKEKKLQKIVEGLIEFLEESNKLFFKERSFLEDNNTQWKILDFNKEREENDLVIKKCMEEIDNLLLGKK